MNERAGTVLYPRAPAVQLGSRPAAGLKPGSGGMSARVSLIVNTACADPVIAERRNPFRSAPYKNRAALLAEEILPRCSGFAEVIVAGVFPDWMPRSFPLVDFIHVAPVRHDRWDALVQREAGARYSSADVFVFCHDDHAPGEGLGARAAGMDADILVPRRVHLRTSATLNNGKADGYMGGHCYAMRAGSGPPCHSRAPRTSTGTHT